jgi:hypothetical protein
VAEDSRVADSRIARVSARWLLVQERLSSLGDNMFGGGIYLAENSSKSFLYTSCPKCNRQVCVRA